MNSFKVYRFTLEGCCCQLAPYDVISNKSLAAALAALADVVPADFLPLSVFMWYTVSIRP